MLTACAARAIGVYLQVGGVYLNVHILRLGEDCDGHGRGMDPALALSLGHTLHAVNAALEFQAGIRTLALDHKADLLEAAEFGRVGIQHLALPALCLGVHGIHPVEHARKERGLLAACAAPYLDDDVLVVVGVARKQQHLEPFTALGRPLPGAVKLLKHHLFEFVLKPARVEQSLCLCGVALGGLAAAVFLDYRGQRFQLLHELLILFKVGDDVAAAQLLVDILEAFLDLFKFIKHRASELFRALSRELPDIFLDLDALEHDLAAALKALDAEIRADTQHGEAVAAAGMLLFHRDDVAHSDIHYSPSDNP